MQSFFIKISIEGKPTDAIGKWKTRNTSPESVETNNMDRGGNKRNVRRKSNGSYTGTKTGPKSSKIEAKAKAETTNGSSSSEHRQHNKIAMVDVKPNNADIDAKRAGMRRKTMKTTADTKIGRKPPEANAGSESKTKGESSAIKYGKHTRQTPKDTIGANSVADVNERSRLKRKSTKLPSTTKAVNKPSKTPPRNAAEIKGDASSSKYQKIVSQDSIKAL